jgi:hypothetical protein
VALALVQLLRRIVPRHADGDGHAHSARRTTPL